MSGWAADLRDGKTQTTEVADVSPTAKVGASRASWRASTLDCIDRFLGIVFNAVGKRWFLALTLVIFITSSAFIAATIAQSIYDEVWHLGIIRLYSHQWGIQLYNNQESWGLGDVEYSSSYLFHYLMSFPFRLLVLWLGDGFATLVCLRLLCVLFYAGGLLLWQRTMLRVTSNPRAVNLAILCFSAVPAFTWIAATVNYDALLFLLVALWAFALVRFVEAQGKSALWGGVMTAAGCFASITKYVFVPVFAVVSLYLLFRWGRETVRAIKSWATVQHPKRYSWNPTLIAIYAMAGLGLSLALSKYLGNLIATGSPAPSCYAVEDEDYCNAFGPAGRNSDLAQQHESQSPQFGEMIILITTKWTQALSSTLTRIGTVGDNGVFATYGNAISIVTLSLATVFVIILGFTLAGTLPTCYRVPLLLALAVHSVALFAVNYTDMLKYGELLAYQSRYFFPYLIPLIVSTILGVSRAIDAVWQYPRLPKLLPLGFVAFGMSQGAWLITFLGVSDANWIAPQSPMTEVYPTLKELVEILVIRGR